MEWRLSAMVVLIALAGCSGFGGETPTETLSPVPVPSEAPESGPGSTILPGISPDGTIESAVLADAHRSALRNRSFVWTESYERRARFGSVTDRKQADRHLVFESPTEYFYSASEPVLWRDSTSVFLDGSAVYADGDYRYIRRSADGDVRYDRRSLDTAAPARFRSLSARAVERYLALDSVDVTPIQVAGTRQYRLVGGRPAGNWSDQLDAFNVTARVTAEGLVRNLSVSYALGGNSSSRYITYQFDFTAVGAASPTEPPWLTAARNASDAPTVSG
ncbi:hypothetical protein Hrd1104_02745 [Halorhabdus sp. CBA1104]|uniref:hypothetical protein n=1 Tax=Halorhabdus sp. CBA1104 TaxID=1380432 RepID=UPI0012B3A0EC|nr:hypothetical protein [Halorhabdus sp. CBA1104]QGN06315.1 hypothetical protein Hrd1104_02745 [Halorhabdus sp. CBA1104]